jgi:hypothetical protein
MSYKDDPSRIDTETAYRRGWQQGAMEATAILLQLLAWGYDRRTIRQYMAIYEDHVVSSWRNSGDLEEKEPCPPFNIKQIEQVAKTHRGYDWLLHDAS